MTDLPQPALSPSGPGPIAIVQNAYIVADLDAACRRLHDLYGIGPFLGGDPVELHNHVHRGVAAPNLLVRGAFVQSGDMNVELIELLCDGPSAFHDMYARGGHGFHHIAYFTADHDAERARLIAMGFPVASEFSISLGGSVSYIDTRATLGHMIELYPENEGIRDRYRITKAAPARWDGRRLLIPWSEADF